MEVGSSAHYNEYVVSRGLNASVGKQAECSLRLGSTAMQTSAVTIYYTVTGYHPAATAFLHAGKIYVYPNSMKYVRTHQVVGVSKANT